MTSQKSKTFPACDCLIGSSGGCTITHYECVDGKDRKRLPYVVPEEIPAGMRCHDCGVHEGELHHPTCDMEECPVCGGQALLCEDLVTGVTYG